MDISNFVTRFFWWQQKTPRTLRPNCLLTRYPLLFVKDADSFLEIFDPWNGIPQYLKSHGYDVRVSLKLDELRNQKNHFIIDGDLASSFMKLFCRDTSAVAFASVTLIDPVFDVSFLEELEQIKIPSQLLFGSLFSKNPLGLVGQASQRIAKTWGPSFDIYEGDQNQIRGRRPRPSHSLSAHEFFLQHCIFLAEYDLTTAE